HTSLVNFAYLHNITSIQGPHSPPYYLTPLSTLRSRKRSSAHPGPPVPQVIYDEKTSHGLTLKKSVKNDV
ncbi:hypothetical protein JYU34_020866, partial [Plutella xylostella]